MRVAFWAVLVLGACADVPGDPTTLVVDGKPVAGYAWSGPGGLAADNVNLEYAGWQIWFTNTASCPTTGVQVKARLEILTPDMVPFPSTALPTLPASTVPLEMLNLHPTAAVADLNVYMAPASTDRVSLSGTLTLTTFSADQVDGTFSAQTQELLGGPLVDAHGTFSAPRCSSIHN